MIEGLKKFWQEEDGVGIVEIILILVILIMIIVLFRTKIVAIVNEAFTNIEEGGTDINGALGEEE